ncbi:MAG TPA: VWA domain-containing protein [Edaphobacter sp.]|nr:VWA domain-containing protein [Edaphobacter sp.]
MPAISLLKPRMLLAVLLLCCAGMAASGQTPSAPPSAAGAAPKRDLTLPQAQPSLTVDRDPILSPDLEEKPPTRATAPTTPSGSNTAQPGDRTLQKEGGGFVLRADVDEVLLPCTVVDEKGRLVTDLSRGDFQVWEDNVPQTIASYQHQDVPVSLGILVDNSGSMRDKRAAVNDAALHLVKASNSADAAFVVNFSDRAFIDQDFTSNVALLEKGLSHLDSRGGTALYDAVVASANQMSRHATQPKQVLLIITDGEDNVSRLTLDQAIRRVQSLNGPVVYSIGLLYEDLSKQEAARARSDLQSLSLETGGVAYFPNSLQDVDEIAAQVARDIRNQYTIGYRSSKAASLGGYRAVRVEARGTKHEKLTVRTRKGYFPKQLQQPQTAQTTH